MIEQRILYINSFEFDCRVAGNEKGELVILLHGFPETSIMWEGLMTHLAKHGFYCIAPDQRGYSEGACPKGVQNYRVDKLSDDILKIVDLFDREKFHLVAHDWGAAIGWNLVFNNPKRIISWTALSIPHNKAFAKAYRTDAIQKKKSRYIGLFLIPFLPEIIIRRNDFKRFRKLWKNSANKEIEHYLTVFRRKSSLTGALNYYRANLKKGKVSPIGNISSPTLFIWGNRDLAVSQAAANGNENYMKGDYKFLEVDGGHWLVQTNYSVVENAITNHLLSYKHES